MSLHMSIRIYIGVIILGANTFTFCLFKQIPKASQGYFWGTCFFDHMDQTDNVRSGVWLKLKEKRTNLIMQDDLCHVYGGVAIGVAKWRTRQPRVRLIWRFRMVLAAQTMRQKQGKMYVLYFVWAQWIRQKIISIISLVYSCTVTWI